LRKTEKSYANSKTKVSCRDDKLNSGKLLESMSEQEKDHNRRLQTISWISTFVASVLLAGLYFGSRFVIGNFANLFADMNVELPVLTRIAIQPWVPSLFMVAAVVVAGKELFIKDKAISLATTGFVVMAAVFACGLIAPALYLPLKGLQQITK
jgi:type II secretory pathway component PulF